MYIDPEDASPFLSIVSAAAPSDASFVPDDLTEVADTRGERERVRLRLFAAKALEAMFAELRACGYDDVSVTKGYVSFDEQQTLYANTLASFAALCPEDEARARTNAAVPPAGLCEDQLGLSVDIHNLPTASQAFESESAYRWLYAHCADFGFVIRYPKNKTELTGHSFEPYHLRFVGRTAAREMAENGWCLEEYASAKDKDASDEG